MNDNQDGVLASAVRSQAQGAELMEKLISVAQPGSVFSEPTTSGEYTIITASEVTVGMGFGFGIGGGTDDSQGGEADEGGKQGQDAQGAGGGGGGGGMSSGRPVAVISVGPDGVEVTPIVDSSKIAIAALAALGGMAMMLGRMRRSGRG